MSPPRSIRTRSTPSAAQSLGGRQQVALVPAPTDGIDRIVLEEQQAVADLAPATAVGEVVLEIPGRSVRNPAEPLDGHHAAVPEQERPGRVDVPRAMTGRSSGLGSGLGEDG